MFDNKSLCFATNSSSLVSCASRSIRPYSVKENRALIQIYMSKKKKNFIEQE